MAEIVKFKYSNTLEDKVTESTDFVVINKGINESEETVESKFGSLYKGKKILGTTESDKLCLTEDIEVAGLGTLGAGIKDGQVISRGTTLQEFLSMLLQKEIWPESLTVTNNKPTITFSAPTFTLSSSGVVEVGTSCILSDSTITAATPRNANKVLGTFTYGYSTSNNNTQEQVTTSVSLASTDAALDSTNYTMTQTITGFSGASGNTTSPNTDPTQVVITGKTLTVGEGSNSVKVVATSPKAVCTLPASSDYYACSNLKHTSEDHKLAATKTSVQTSAISTQTTTKSVTGQYKWFLGYSSHTKASEFTSEEVRALNAKSSSWITINGSTTIVANGEKLTSPGGTQNIVIAVPEKYELSSINGDLGNDLMGNIVEPDQLVEVTTGSINTNYKIYLLISSAKLVFQNVTIRKA